MNDRQVEALADELEGCANNPARDSTEAVVECDVLRRAVKALRSRTPSAPDVAMREALREKLQRAIIRPKSHDGPVRLCDQIDEVMKIVDAALSAKAGEPVAAYIQREALAELAKHKDATATVSSGLLKKPFDNPVALYAAPTPPQVDREAVARIVDPDAKFDNFSGVKWSIREIERRDLAYTKADAILSLLAPTAPAQEGE
jgi:hypothetical protein